MKIRTGILIAILFGILACNNQTRNGYKSKRSNNFKPCDCPEFRANNRFRE